MYKHKNEFRYLCKYIFTLCGIFAQKYIFCYIYNTWTSISDYVLFNQR